MEWWWAAYLVLGLFVGFFAGLLGIGGGLIIVTALVFMFTHQGFPGDRVVHLALGTSLTSIVFTSLSSIRAHQRHGAVRWDIIRRVVVGVVIGTLLGTLFADALPSRYLAIFFTVHDPTTPNRQGHDVGTQYRSAIYYGNDAQGEAVRRFVDDLARRQLFADPIVTEVAPLERFWRAEDYHQRYFENHPGQGYCAFVVAPKVEKFRKTFAARLKR